MAVRSLLPGWKSTLGIGTLGTWTLGGLTAVAALSAGFVGSTSSETVLRNSFSAALGSAALSQQQVAKSAPIAGTEDFWLTADRSSGSLAVTKAVSIGDHIALTLGGRDRDLEVAAVSEYAPKTTEIDTRAGKSHFVLVTARDTASKDARSVRFVMEIEQAPVATLGVQARAL
jgi:hypothetical protein